MKGEGQSLEFLMTKILARSLEDWSHSCLGSSITRRKGQGIVVSVPMGVGAGNHGWQQYKPTGEGFEEESAGVPPPHQ